MNRFEFSFKYGKFTIEIEEVSPEKIREIIIYFALFNQLADIISKAEIVQPFGVILISKLVDRLKSFNYDIDKLAEQANEVINLENGIQKVMIMFLKFGFNEDEISELVELMSSKIPQDEFEKFIDSLNDDDDDQNVPDVFRRFLSDEE